MTPRFDLSKSKVLEQYKKVEALADIVSYSSKTNTDVTPILESETDSMFSVHTVNALKHIKNKSRVVFIAQGWTADDIAELTEKGIEWFVVDNEVDLDTLLKFLRENEVRVNLLLRLKLKEYTVKTERYYVFGMGSEVIKSRVAGIRGDAGLNAKLKGLGIHFHRKTQNLSEWNLNYELSNMFDENFLGAIDFVNIGGGLPSEYANTNLAVIEGIFERIAALRKWLNGMGLRLIIEPGRFIAAPSCRLVTKIISIHESTIIVDASVYNGDLDAIVVPVKLLIEGELKKGEGKPFLVKGSTPCSMDIFRYRVYLKDPRVGDELVFLNAGAYNFSSDFCDLEKVPTFVKD